MAEVLYFVGGVFATLAVWVLENRRKRRRPQLRSAVQSESVFASDRVHDVPELSLRFENSTVNSLVLSRVAVWNGGQGSVTSELNAKRDPLRIKLPPGDKPIHYRTVYEGSTPVAVAERSEWPSELVFEFDFLDEGQGAVIEILHELGEPEVVGSLSGVDKNPSRELSLSTQRLEKLRSRSGRRQRLWDRYGFLVLLGVILVAVALWTTLDFYRAVVDPTTDTIVASDQYDLATLEGQRDFAEAVQGREAEVSELNVAGAWGLVIVILGGFALFAARKPEVPPSILLHKPNGKGSD